jgi:hypothetical protein
MESRRTCKRQRNGIDKQVSRDMRGHCVGWAAIPEPHEHGGKQHVKYAASSVENKKAYTAPKKRISERNTHAIGGQAR